MNERHELKCKIAHFNGRPALEGQLHLYDVEQYYSGEEPFCPKVEVGALFGPKFVAPMYQVLSFRFSALRASLC